MNSVVVSEYHNVKTPLWITYPAIRILPTVVVDVEILFLHVVDRFWTNFGSVFRELLHGDMFQR
jgi:hypothetical protein